MRTANPQLQVFAGYRIRDLRIIYCAGGKPRLLDRPKVVSQFDPMRPSVISTTMVQHHVKKPIGEFSLTLASMSAIFYLSVN